MGGTEPRDPAQVIDSIRGRTRYFADQDRARARFRQTLGENWQEEYGDYASASAAGEPINAPRAWRTAAREQQIARREMQAERAIDRQFQREEQQWNRTVEGVQREAENIRRAPQRMGGGGGGGGGGPSVPWYAYGGIGGNRVFGMESRLGTVAAAYFAWRAVSGAVSNVDEYLRPSSMSATGNVGGSDQLAFQRAVQVNQSAARKTWENFKMTAYGVSRPGEDYAGDYLETATVQMINNAERSEIIMGTARIRGLAAELPVARSVASVSGIIDPLAAARVRQSLVSQQVTVRIGNQARELRAKAQDMYNQGPQGRVEAARLEKQAEQLELTIPGQVAVGRASAMADIYAIQAQRQLGQSVMGMTMRATSLGSRGDLSGAAAMSIAAQFAPQLAQAESDPVHLAVIGRLQAEETAASQLEIRRSVGGQFWSSRSSVSSMRGRYWEAQAFLGASYRSAMQGLEPGSERAQQVWASYQPQFAQLSIHTQDMAIQAEMAAPLASAVGGLRHYEEARLRSEMQWRRVRARYDPDSPEYTIGMKEHEGTIARIEAQKKIEASSINTQAFAADLRAQFKPVAAGFAGIYNTGAISAMQRPEMRSQIGRLTEANMRGAWAQYISSAQMGGLEPGFGWQVGTSGQETGYEDIRDLSTMMTNLFTLLKGNFTPLSGAYQ